MSTSLVTRGILQEYSPNPAALRLVFAFNPTTIARTRTVSIRTGGSPGSRGGYDFASYDEVPRASQGVSVQAEGFNIKILLDATDRMARGDPAASELGIEPEIDILRAMVEPKTLGPPGLQTLAALGEGGSAAFSHHEYCSVLIFRWGQHALPVFLTQVQIESKEFLPNLSAYRAEATLGMQVIESSNPLYNYGKQRQLRSAAAASVALPLATLSGVGR